MEQPKVHLAEDFDATWREGHWQFFDGREFPGARGAFSRSPEAAHSGAQGGKLDFDFSGGGNYVSAMLALEGAPSVGAVRLWLKNPGGNSITFRYTDTTGQTLQRRLALPPYGEWSEVEIECADWNGHWGGANDGVVHGAPTQIAFLVENDGKKQGSVLFDEVRLVEGKPELPVWNYAALRFAPGEGWSAGAGGGAASRLEGRRWRFDFSGGGEWAGLFPSDLSLLGTPKEIRVRVRGERPAHSARLRLATHFMTFERSIGPAVPAAGGKPGEWEFVTPAPPGEGWRWYGGENDGKLHGPLRVTGLFLDAGGKKDAGELELLEVRVAAECSARRVLSLTAQCRAGEGRPEFVASVRSLATAPTGAELRWEVRDWAGKALAQGTRKLEVPAGAVPLSAAVPLPVGEHHFAEAEFSLAAPGQEVAPVQAYYVAPVPAPTQADRLEPDSPFGMGLYLYRYSGDARSLAEMERAAQMGSAAGVKWSREEFAWQRIEPRKGEFDWSFYDQVVAAAKRHGISLYAILSYWSPWTKPYTPEGIADYCRFVTAVVQRYHNDIHHWEIWNEPNIFFWQGPKEMYAELLKQAYAAVKQVDPQALVLGCSTAGIDRAFIKQMIDLGAPFDVLTIHPYRAHLDDAAFIRELQQTAELVRRPDGTARPVWITEFGWATHVPHNSLRMDFAVTTQRRQAELIARAYLDAIVSGAAPNISWYDFRNDGTDPLNFEHNMGIITRDFQPKPAYRAYATMAHLLRGLKPAGALDLGAGVIAHRFAAPGRPEVLCLWSTEGERTVAVPAAKGMRLIGLMGDAERLAPVGGKASVALREGVPVFVAGE